MDLSIRLDTDRAVFRERSGTSETFEVVPSRIAPTTAGVVVGDQAVARGGQPVLDPGALAVPDDAAADSAPGQLPVGVFLAACVGEFWGDLESGGPSVDGEPTDGGQADGSGLSATVSVPGWLDADQRAAVRRAARSAHLPECRVVCRPTQVAAALASDRDSALPRPAPGALALVVDVGDRSADLGVYEATETGLRARRRTNVEGLGSADWSRAVATTLLAQAGEARDVTVEYTDGALAELSAAVREAVGGDSTLPVSVELELADGVTLTAGDHTLSESLELDREITTGLLHAALEDYAADLAAAATDVLADADVTPDDLSTAVLAGDGADLEPLRNALAGHVGEATTVVQYPLGGAEDPAPPADTDTVTDTLDGAVRVVAMDGEDLAATPTGGSLAGVDTVRQVSVATRTPEGQHGRLDVEVSDPATGEPRVRASFTVSGFPAVAGDEQAATTLGASVTGDPPVSADDIELEVIESTSETAPTVDRETYDDGTWLQFADEGEFTPLPDRARTPMATYARQRDDRGPDRPDPKAVIEAIHSVRTNLWQWGIVKENPLDPDNVEIILRELDQSSNSSASSFSSRRSGPRPGRGVTTSGNSGRPTNPRGRSSRCSNPA
ncbi:Hsp70 family protein [Haloarcula regularis]|uniref:Hsp70 family protein n=1 Tax=Haloarcula regularis TaxID=3033392 RepID=UPI0023E8AD4C|nr:Hsp70 family protein [Halomicroarcula sp. SYNS111]